MNDSEKLHEVYGKLVDLNSKVLLLQSLDINQDFFSSSERESLQSVLLTGVVLFSKDLRNNIEEIFKILDI